jgi:hypothetical protein
MGYRVTRDTVPRIACETRQGTALLQLFECPERGACVSALACACVRAGVGEQTRALLHFDVAVTVAADPNIRTDAWVAWVPAHEPRVSTRAAAAYAARLSRCAPQRTPESRMLLAEYAAAPVQDAAPCASMESPCAGILD